MKAHARVDCHNHVGRKGYSKKAAPAFVPSLYERMPSGGAHLPRQTKAKGPEAAPLWLHSLVSR